MERCARGDPSSEAPRGDKYGRYLASEEGLEGGFLTYKEPPLKAYLMLSQAVPKVKKNANTLHRIVLSTACWDSSFISDGLVYEDARTRRMSLIDGVLSERVLALPFHEWAFSICKLFGDEAEDGVDYKAMENGEIRREQEFCRFITEIELSLLYQAPPKDLDPPCYLFVLPLPQCPDSTPDIETWLHREKIFYYSYNPEGGSAITEEECISLGLPPLLRKAHAYYLQWDNSTYDFMEEWQKAKGFDYTTADYAKSLGIPDLLARPQEERHFEDLTDSPDVLEADLMDVDSDKVAHTTETRAPSGLSEEVEDDRMDVD
ncbi:hypothetical protein PQX77_019122 [Marasmius sp. AFHP31]|nr:hypothetical protein PQX77_019122 [Marasmius sp. AFHP31]